MPVFRPTYVINGDVTDIDLDILFKDGIRGLIFDLDSTLIAPKAGVLTDEVSEWLSICRSRFQVVVVSNNKRSEYLEKVKEELKMPVIGFAYKPSRRGFYEALRLIDLEAAQVAVVGDRPLTDVWGGLRSGMRTVLVRPLKTIVEPRWKTYLREMERILIRQKRLQ